MSQEKNSYYNTCAIPKPVNKKKKNKTNGFKNKPKRFCYYCGTPYAERHEVFGGSNRQWSIDNGYQVDLCHECHRGITENSVEGVKRNKYWRQYYQKKHEDKLISAGASPDQAREMFINQVGRSYR